MGTNRYIFFTLLFSFSVLLSLSAGSSRVFAQTPPNNPPVNQSGSTRSGGLVPCGLGDLISNVGNRCTVRDIFSLIARVTNYLIGVAGIFAVFQIVLNSFNMIVFSGNAESVKKAKEGLVNAVLGLVFVMMAFGLIYTVIHGILGLKFEGNVLVKPTEFIQNSSQPPGQ